MNDKHIIVLHPDDNIAVALADLSLGDVIQVGEHHIILKSDISFGHKFSLNLIPKGFHILKCGLPIGISICNIEQGEWVHSHNLRSDYKPVFELK